MVSHTQKGEFPKVEVLARIYLQDKVERSGRKKEKHFLLPTQEMGVDFKWWFLSVAFVLSEVENTLRDRLAILIWGLQLVP
jgi:hypothetical protein